MNNAVYTQLTRQTGLQREMDLIAGNMANMNTTGFRREGVVFSEFLRDTDDRLGSLSMAAVRTRYAEPAQGALTQTLSQLDLAVEGEGFFQVQTPDGPRLTRAGAFAISADNQLVTPEGFPVLDNGGAAIQLPAGFERMSVAVDGLISVDGEAFGQMALVTPIDPLAVRREGGSLYIADGGVQPSEGAKISQGFLEGSNVNAVEEITRMIEVQRAYELGQSMLERMDDRMRTVIRTMGEPVR
ncbi:MAG: flagellar hook-basal body complex protein [Pseudomonadota bacterium]